MPSFRLSKRYPVLFSPVNCSLRFENLIVFIFEEKESISGRRRSSGTFVRPHIGIPLPLHAHNHHQVQAQR